MKEKDSSHNETIQKRTMTIKIIGLISLLLLIAVGISAFFAWYFKSETILLSKIPKMWAALDARVQSIIKSRRSDMNLSVVHYYDLALESPIPKLDQKMGDYQECINTYTLNEKTYHFHGVSTNCLSINGVGIYWDDEGKHFYIGSFVDSKKEWKGFSGASNEGIYVGDFKKDVFDGEGYYFTAGGVNSTNIDWYEGKACINLKWIQEGSKEKIYNKDMKLKCMKIDLKYFNHYLPDMKLVCDSDSETQNCIKREILARDFMKENQEFHKLDETPLEQPHL